MESIGEILKQERLKRGLDLEQVHEASKITPQNLTALEEDRFDYFPNKVYARAFLRDYANYLGIDSAALLTRYEKEWNTDPKEPEAAEPRVGRPIWKIIAYSLTSLLVIGGVGAAVYFGWLGYEKQDNPVRVKKQTSTPVRNKTATLPTVKPIDDSNKLDVTPKPEPQPEPAVPVDKLTLQVTALMPVWVKIDVDGKQEFANTIAKGQTMTWEAKKKIYIQTGMAGAVQLKLNGQPQPSLGSLKVIGKRMFTLPEPVAPPQTPVSTPPATESSPL